MAELAEPEFVWGRMAEQVARLMGLVTNRSPTLKSVIERGVRYINIDDGERQLVFDTRALVVGFLATGRDAPDSIRYGNTASWFVTWLEERTSREAIAQALERTRMASPDRIAETSAYEVVLSVSVQGLLAPADALAQATTDRQVFEARHLFAAMIEKGVVSDQVRQLFQVDLSDNDLMDLRIRFIERVMGAPDANETRERWYRALGLDDVSGTSAVPRSPDAAEPSGVRTATGTASGGSGARAFAAPVDGVTGFQSDRVAAAGDDLLDTLADARALARLICLDDAAPMAVAIFGGWGSGKSTFMATLDQEVRGIVGSQARRREDRSGAGDEAGSAATFISRVVQMRFNAWQFVDANLWTSLTAEFFDQLRAGGWNRLDQARHAGLVERVNRHVHSLTAEVEVARDAAAVGSKDLLDAQRARDKAAEDGKKAKLQALGQAGVDMLGDAYESQKQNLTKLGMTVAGVDAGKAIDAVIDIVKNSRTIPGQIGAVWRLLRKTGLRFWTAIVSAAVLLAALAWICVRGLTHADLVSAFMALGALGTLSKSLEPAVKLVRSVAERGGEIARSVEEADGNALKALLQTEIRLREVSREAAALQATADGAALRLARYVDPDGVANPPRLLRYILEDDPDTKALAAEVGLIGRTRRLFEAVDDIVRTEREKPADQRVDGDVPDRIILYIDDLDRCTEEQVYSVLQATHLLLAFDLFVVVVGVDVNWVHRALGKALGDDAGPDEEVDAGLRQRAAAYLDKIFQVAFWLSPLSHAGADGGSYARYVRSLAAPRSTATSPSDELAGGAPNETGSNLPSQPGANDPHLGEVREDSPPSAGNEPGASAADTQAAEDRRGADARQEQVLRTIELLPDEITFLASAAIGGLASSTPRGVKRLVNVYRLVRTRLSEVARDASWGEGPDHPLIALAAAVETGQSVGVADAFYAWLRTLDDEADFGQAFLALHEAADDIAGDTASDAAGKTAGPAPRDLLAKAELKRAVEAVVEASGSVRGIDMRRIARITRRYSFNRYF